MTNPITSEADEKTYLVWADRRCFQQVQASSPEEAFAEAQKYPGDFEPCSEGIENFELHPVVADLDTDEEFTVGPKQEDPVKAELLAACEYALAFMESIPHRAGLTNINADPLIAAIKKAS